MNDLMDSSPENLNSRRAPRATLSDRLVVYLDLLGFGSELEAVTDQASFSDLYTKLGIVQQEFEVPSTYNDKAGAEALDKYWGREVFAFSDCVVTALTLNCEAAGPTGEHDLVADAVNSLALAHARCFVNKGILLRGGISHGWFFREQDKLLSGALVRAHKIESNLMKGPFIGLRPETLEWLRSFESRDDRKAGREVTRYFKPMPECDSNLHFLDYLTALIRSEEPRKVRKIFSMHKQRILEWMNSECSGVREKQMMVVKYHNSVVADFGAFFVDCEIQ